MSAFTACSNEEDIPQAAQANGSELVIKNVGVAEVGTKAGILGSSFAEGAAIGVFLNAGDLGSAYNASGETSKTTNVSYTKGASDWTWGDPIMLSSTVGTVRAYYPYNSSYSGTGVDVPVSVSASQSALAVANDQTDYMYASPVGDISNAYGKSTVATLTMNHALAMVTFKFVNDDNTPYVGEGLVQKIKLFNGTKQVIKTGAGTMNINDGNITISGEAVMDGITMTLTGDEQKLKDENEPAKLPHLLVYPYSETNGNGEGKDGFADNDVKTTITLDDAEYTFGLPGIEGGYQAGSNYVYTFTLKGTQLTITNVEISDWSEKPQTGGDIATPDHE